MSTTGTLEACRRPASVSPERLDERRVGELGVPLGGASIAMAEHATHEVERHARGVPAGGTRVLRAFVHADLRAEGIGRAVPLLAQGVRNPAPVPVPAGRVRKERRRERPGRAPSRNRLAPFAQAPVQPIGQLLVDRDPARLASLRAADRGVGVRALRGAADAEPRHVLSLLQVGDVQRSDLAGAHAVARGEEGAAALERDPVQDRALGRAREDRRRVVGHRNGGERRHAVDQIEPVEPRHECAEVPHDIPHRLRSEAPLM